MLCALPLAYLEQERAGQIVAYASVKPVWLHRGADVRSPLLGYRQAVAAYPALYRTLQNRAVVDEHSPALLPSVAPAQRLPGLAASGHNNRRWAIRYFLRPM